MTGTLAQAVTALEKVFGPGAAAKNLRRCEVDDEGELVLTLEQSGVTRWFRTQLGRPIEIFPDGDEAVPAAAALSARVRAGEARILSWRPGRRIVTRVDGSAGSRIVKGHRPKRFERALAAHRAAVERVGADAFTVAPLLETDPLQATLYFGILAGAPLEPTRTSHAAFAEIGRRISRLQRASADDLPTHTRKDEIALLSRAATRTERALGSLPEGWRALLERLEPLALRPAVCEVAAHRDLHDGQILVDAGRFALLDFDLLARAESALDPANLSVHIELRFFEEQGPGSFVPARAAVEALLEGTGRRGDPGFAEAFAFHRASTVLRLALLCALKPASTSSVPPMLARAREALEECERS